MSKKYVLTEKDKKFFSNIDNEEKLDRYINSINNKDDRRNKKEKGKKKDKDFIRKYGNDDDSSWN